MEVGDVREEGGVDDWDGGGECVVGFGEGMKGLLVVEVAASRAMLERMRGKAGNRKVKQNVRDCVSCCHRGKVSNSPLIISNCQAHHFYMLGFQGELGGA